MEKSKENSLENLVAEDQKLFEESHELSDYFKTQLDLIKDSWFRILIDSFLDTKVNSFVFEKSTSSTGKYHPVFQNGKCGNGIHTKNVVKILQVFERAHPGLNWDTVYAAAILHDCTKYEKEDSKYTDGKHALTAAQEFKDFAKVYLSTNCNWKEKRKFAKLVKETAYNIKWHDGRFNPLNATKEQIGQNYTKKFYKNVKTAEAHLLHLADMISANKALWEEWF